MTRSEQKRRGRRARVVGGATVLVVVLGTGVVVALAQASEAHTPPAPPPAVATATVTKTDLSAQEDVDGTLGYGGESDVTGRKPGTITSLPAVGNVITQGQSVYGVDAAPVPLFYGRLPFYRDLAVGATDGPDVQQLEENLKALGYNDFGTPDKKFTAATASALKRFQQARGLPQTGAFSPGDVVLAAGPVRVSTLTGQLGGPAAGPVLKVTGTGRVVTVQLDVAKQGLAKVGDQVKVDVNGASGAGKVVDVGRAATPGKDANGQPNGKTTVPVTISLDDPRAAGDLDTAPVTVHFVKEVHKDVLVAPVGALLALAEGGYAVEVEQNGQRRLVPVKTGLFANGQVEIAGPGLAAGMTVVTTS
ncbi:peptidoglycan-binding protein [Kutzneria sp. NPDC052558]|uniref:peptidoglycan-binding protein n=1 Tax=Kutzneria sp. NPDC052558 TaxID=3364121 RepID=UPI0037CA0CFB